MPPDYYIKPNHDHTKPIPCKLSKDDRKIALALGSGSARGWSHIGVIRALHEAGIVPDIICGSSIGALVGASYVNGHLPDLETWARRLTRWKMVRFVDLTLSNGSVIDANKLRTEISHVIGDKGALIEELPIRFAAVATELLTGHEVKFTRGPLGDAIWSSAAIPGILPPLSIRDEWLIDGGVVNPVPVNLCRYLDADIVIAVNLNGDIVGRRSLVDIKAELQAESEDEEKQDSSFSKLKETISNLYPFSENGDRPVKLDNPEDALPAAPNMFETFADAINIMQDRITRSRMVGDPPDILITPSLSNMGMMDFNRAGHAIDIGYESVQRLLPEIKHRLGIE